MRGPVTVYKQLARFAYVRVPYGMIEYSGRQRSDGHTSGPK